MVRFLALEHQARKRSGPPTTAIQVVRGPRIIVGKVRYRNPSRETGSTTGDEELTPL